MKKILILIGALVPLAASAQPAQTYYQIDLAPTGKMISVDVPLIKGNTYLFHAYPSGTLQSLRKSDVVRVTKIAPQVATQPAETLVQIGNLAMQGGSSQAGATNARAVAPKKGGPELGQGFYSDLKFGQSLAADAAAANDYAIGRSYAAPPSSGVQSSPARPRRCPPRRAARIRRPCLRRRTGRSRSNTSLRLRRGSAPFGRTGLRLACGLDRAPDPLRGASLPRRGPPPSLRSGDYPRRERMREGGEPSCRGANGPRLA